MSDRINIISQYVAGIWTSQHQFHQNWNHKSTICLINWNDFYKGITKQSKHSYTRDIHTLSTKIIT